MTTTLRFNEEEAEAFNQLKIELDITGSELLRVGLRKVYQEYQDTQTLQVRRCDFKPVENLELNELKKAS